MNILKKIRSPFLSLSLAFLVLFVSCSQDYNTNNSEQKVFDYTEYNSMKQLVGTLEPLNIKSLKSIAANSDFFRQDKKRQVLNIINESISEEPTLQIEALEYFDLTSGEDVLEKAVLDGVLTDIDLILINELTSDINNLGLDNALVKFEQEISSLNLSDYEFEKYNKFANNLLLVQDELISNNMHRLDANSSSGPGWGCGLAILSFTVATVFLGTTCVPNPVTIYACPIAIARTALAYTSMLVACSD